MNVKKMMSWALPLALMALVTGGCQRSTTHDPQRAVSYLTGKLDLDTAQQTRLTDILEAYAAGHGAHAGERDRTHAEVTALLRRESLDPASVEHAVDQGVDRVAAQFRAFGTVLSEVHALLTPEQRDKLADLIEKHAGKRHRFH